MGRLPFAIPVTAYLGIDDIKARAAGKVFQVLRFQVSPSPGAPMPVRKEKWNPPQKRQPVPELLRQRWNTQTLRSDEDRQSRSAVYRIETVKFAHTESQSLPSPARRGQALETREQALAHATEDSSGRWWRSRSPK